MIALSGYGATGPESEFVSYGPAQVPLSGMSSLTGYAGLAADARRHLVRRSDRRAARRRRRAGRAAAPRRHRRRPVHRSLAAGDQHRRARRGRARADASTGAQPPRDGNRDPHMAPHGVFRCAGEQRWVAIAVRDDDEWRRCAARAWARRSSAPTRASPRSPRARRTRTSSRRCCRDVDAAAARRGRRRAAAGAPAFPPPCRCTTRTSPKIRISPRSGFFVNLRASRGRHAPAPRHSVAHVRHAVHRAPRRALPRRAHRRRAAARRRVRRGTHRGSCASAAC